MTAAPPPFPFMHPDPCTPPPEYAELRRTAAVTRVALPTGYTAWLVTRHDNVRAALIDPRLSREALTTPDAPPLLPMPPQRRSLFFSDPPGHTRLRRLVAPAFASEQIERMRPGIEQIVKNLLDAMATDGPPADLLQHAARPLPMLVLFCLFGVPDDDIDTLGQQTEMMFAFGTRPQEDIQAAHQHVHDYFLDLVAHKRAYPGDDLLTNLIDARDGNDRLTDAELVALVHDLLGAGIQPVTAEIVHGVLTLLREDRFRLIQQQPKLLAGAIEELLRHSQSAGGGLLSVRVATQNVQLGDVMIPAGDAVIPSLNAANLDENVFPQPDRFEPRRTPNSHLAFGDGAHHCVGIHVGRIELQAFFAAIAQRFPKLRLVIPENDLVWTPGVAFRTPVTLPVEW
jgi:cytochrome P450